MGSRTLKWRIFASAAGVSAAALALSACGSGSNPAESQGGNEAISFVTWVGGDAGEKWENVADAYEEATGVPVDIEIVPSETYDQVISSRIEAGNAPDLIETITDKQAGFVDGGLLTDLSDQPWVSQGIPAVQGFQDYFDGKTYAFIPALDVAGVFYNVEIFEANGLEVPTTWEEFETTVEVLKTAGITPLAVGAKDGWTLNVQANQMATGALYDTDQTLELRDGTLPFSESSWVDVLDAWDGLIKNGAYDAQALGIDWPSSANQFASGDAAMIIQGSFALPAIREAAPDLNVGIFPLPFPAGATSPVASVSYGSMLAVPTGAANETGAKDFLDFIAQPENLLGFLNDAKAFSGVNGVTPEVDPALESIAELVETRSAEYNLTPGASVAVVSEVATGVQGLFAGTATVADVLAAMDRAQQNG